MLKMDFRDIYTLNQGMKLVQVTDTQESHYYQFLSNITGEDFSISDSRVDAFQQEVINDFKDLRGVLQSFELQNVDEIVRQYKNEKMMMVAL